MIDSSLLVKHGGFLTCSRTWLGPHQPSPLSVVMVEMISGGGGGCDGGDDIRWCG